MSIRMLGVSTLLTTLLFCLLPAHAEPEITGKSTKLASADRWATVKKDGTLVRGHGAVAAQRGSAQFDLPIYKVTFDKDVTVCGYVATVSSPGMATVKQAIDDTHAVIVYTRGIDGQRADLGFSLHVSCAIDVQANVDPWVVVSGPGSLVRANGLYTVERKSAGQYRVYFNRPVDTCVYAATVGLPGSTGPEPKGTVSVSPQTDNSVWVYTLSEANSYGDRGFHLWIGCDLDAGDRSFSGSSDIVVNGKGAKSVEHLGEGRYVVKFNRDVSECGLFATTGLSGGPGGVDSGSVPPGRISAKSNKGSPKEVSVTTGYGPDPLDRPFHLIAGCD